MLSQLNVHFHSNETFGKIVCLFKSILQFLFFRFDLKLGKLVVKGGFDRTEALGKNYTIEEGKIVDISASGHGKFNLTMGKLQLRSSACSCTNCNLTIMRLKLE